MNFTTRALLSTAVTLAAVSGSTHVARADIGACNDIFVEASATCEVVPPSVECEAMCTPITVRATCSASLAVECRAECDELPRVDCQVDCSGKCEASCTKLEPGKFDCAGTCRADCSGRCSAQCEGNEDGAGCMASCQGSCSASCNASCEVEPPQADCEASCEASCEGSCEVDTNIDCQARCQADARADCEVDVKGSCVAECKKEDGALFCDGQFIDHGDNLDECIAALKAKYNIKVEASGEASCDGGRCEASGRVSAKSDNLCSVATPGDHDRHGIAAFGVLGVFFALVLRRRHRNEESGRNA